MVFSKQFTLFYDSIYSSGLDPKARFPINRYEKLYKTLKDLDTGREIAWRRPNLATKEDIELVHCQDYVERFLNNDLREQEIRRIGLRPWKNEIVERTLRLVGGSLAALDLALSGHLISGNMAGGTHHAFKNQGAGYCIFNDLAICARKALLSSKIRRVLILDLDVHQGDGTAEIFAGDDRVFTVSLHGKNNFPFRKRVSDLDFEFENDTEDKEYLGVLDEVLQQLALQDFDIIFYQAGVDALESDGLGLLSLTRNGLMERNRKVLKWRRKMQIPMTIFMGGGYSKPIDETVDAFSELFLFAAKQANHQQA